MSKKPQTSKTPPSAVLNSNCKSDSNKKSADTVASLIKKQSSDKNCNSGNLKICSSSAKDESPSPLKCENEKTKTKDESTWTDSSLSSDDRADNKCKNEDLNNSVSKKAQTQIKENSLDRKSLVRVCYKCIIISSMSILLDILFTTMNILVLVQSFVRKQLEPYNKGWVVGIVAIGIATFFYMISSLIRIIFFLLIICTKQKPSKHEYLRKVQQFIGNILPIIGRIEACSLFIELASISLISLVNQPILMQTFHWITFGICMLFGLIFIILANIFTTVTRTKVYRAIIPVGISMMVFLISTDCINWIKTISPIIKIFDIDDLSISIINGPTKYFMTNAVRLCILLVDILMFCLPFILFFLSISWQIDNLLPYSNTALKDDISLQAIQSPSASKKKSKWYHKREVSLFVLLLAKITSYLFNIVMISQAKYIKTNWGSRELQQYKMN